MNGLERFQAVLGGRPTDILARMPILMAFKADFAGVTYADFASRHEAKVEANVRTAEAFGIDMFDVMSDPYSETADFGGRIEFPRDEVPRCPAPPLAATKDLGLLLKPDPATSRRMSNTVETVRGLCGRAEGRRSVHGWVEGPAAEAADLRGVETFLLDLLTDPAWCGELMDVCTDNAVRFARAQIEAGADVIGVGDAVCSQIPPGVYGELVAPRQNRLFQAIADAGAHVRLHICGSTNHIFEFVRHMPVALMDIDHVADIELARKVLGAGVALSGNLDPVEDILHGSPAAIREGLIDLYHRVGNPYVVTAGCEIPRQTPHENLRALCEPVPFEDF